MRAVGVLLMLRGRSPTAAIPAQVATAGSEQRCTWVDLADPKPLWTPRMAWSADGARLLIPDLTRQEIFVYRADGSLEERLRRPRDSGLECADGEESLLQCWASHLLRLTPEGTVAGGLDVGSRVFAGERRVGRLLTWTAVGEWIYGFGEVWREGGAVGAAWVRFTYVGKPRLEVIREVSPEQPERRCYSLGFPYAATVRGRAYLLVMEQEPYLLEMTGMHERRLRSFPEGFERRPMLLSAQWGGDEVAAMAAVEAARLPVGLFGWRNRLFVLTRRPALGGATVWELTGIEPLTDRVVSRVRLPTVAPHLTAAPGPESWAFLEKGPAVQARLAQAAATLLFVPATWLHVPREHGWGRRCLPPFEVGG